MGSVEGRIQPCPEGLNEDVFGSALEGLMGETVFQGRGLV